MQNAENPGPSAVEFRAPLQSHLMSAAMVGASTWVVYLCIDGLYTLSGLPLLILGITTVFPVLVLIVAVLRLVVGITRRLVMGHEAMDHHQLFKEYRVPWASIRKLELLQPSPEELPSVVRVIWTGQYFYLERRAFEDFDELLQILEARVPAGIVSRVESFAPVEASG